MFSPREGDKPGALKDYQEALGIARQLLAAAELRPGAGRLCSPALGRVGDAELAEADAAQAVADYAEALTVDQKLVRGRAGS